MEPIRVSVVYPTVFSNRRPKKRRFFYVYGWTVSEQRHGWRGSTFRFGLLQITPLAFFSNYAAGALMRRSVLQITTGCGSPFG
ncbi:hypothetical protein R50072_26400 [Simiduia litorea]